MIKQFWSNKKTRVIVYFVGYIISVCLVIALIVSLEEKQIIFKDFSEILKIREAAFGTIRSSYLTLSIGVLSIGTIAFTLVLSRIQSLTSEVNYESFIKKAEKDFLLTAIYVSLMLLSLIMLIIHLVFDISLFPFTYIVILVILFFTVVLLLYLLFKMNLKDLSLLTVLEDKLETIINESKKYSDVIAKLNSSTIKKSCLGFSEKRVKKLRRQAEYRYYLLFLECHKSIDEMDNMSVNACRREDPVLLEKTYKLVNKLVENYFKTMIQIVNDNIVTEDELSYEQNYMYILGKTLSIYETPENLDARTNLTYIAHRELGNLIKTSYSLFDELTLFSRNNVMLMYEVYYMMTKYELSRKSNLSTVLNYNELLKHLVENVSHDKLDKLIKTVSINNVGLVKKLISSEYENLIYLIIKNHSTLIKKSLDSCEIRTVKSVLLNLFDIFNKTVEYQSSKDDFVLYNSNSNWLDKNEINSVPKLLRDYFISCNSDINTKEANESRAWDVVEFLYLLLANNKIKIEKAIAKDERVYYGFIGIIDVYFEICSKNLNIENSEYPWLNLLKAMFSQYCDYIFIFDGSKKSSVVDEFERVFLDFCNNDLLRENAVKDYVFLLKNLVGKSQKDMVNDEEHVGFTNTAMSIEDLVIQLCKFDDRELIVIIDEIETIFTVEEYEYLLKSVAENVASSSDKDSLNGLISTDLPFEFMKAKYRNWLFNIKNQKSESDNWESMLL